ncbi:hypothetical protein Vafri_6614, partial [Volvox africanus]
MVRLASFAARNAETRSQAQADLRAPGSAAASELHVEETPEAQEACLVASYQAALMNAAEGRVREAVEGFQAVLRHPLLVAGPDGAAGTRGTLRELRLLATRNLADQLGVLEEQQRGELQQGHEDGEQMAPEYPGSEDGSSTNGTSMTTLRLQLYGEAI